MSSQIGRGGWTRKRVQDKLSGVSSCVAILAEKNAFLNLLFEARSRPPTHAVECWILQVWINVVTVQRRFVLIEATVFANPSQSVDSKYSCLVPPLKNIPKVALSADGALAPVELSRVRFPAGALSEKSASSLSVRSEMSRKLVLI